MEIELGYNYVLVKHVSHDATLYEWIICGRSYITPK